MKISTLTFLLFISSIFASCRFANYRPIPTAFVDVQLVFSNSKILVLPFDINQFKVDRDLLEKEFIDELRKIDSAEILDLLKLYEIFPYDLMGAPGIDEKLELLAAHTEIDFVIDVQISATENDIWIIDSPNNSPNANQNNAATAFIRVYEVKQQRLYKEVAYRGSTNNRGESDFEYELYRSSNHIARKCFKKCRKKFFRDILLDK